METASGFKLNEDSTFDFFFSYGALDRSGKGTWKINGDKVILSSPKPNGQDFALIANKTVDKDQISIKIREENPFFLSGVYAMVKSGDKQLEGKTNKEGLISFPKGPVDSIVLLFEFAPEKTAIFAFTNKKDNYFEFRFEPWALDVFFENLPLTIDETGLTGQHPLLREGKYHFIKN